MGKLFILIVLLFCIVTASAQGKKKKCRALALEGGGDLGSYQVGVLKAFVDNLPKEETQWDVITGVSVGSINAVAIALHDIGQEEEAIDWMVDLWEDFTKGDIYENWDYGLLQGLFFKQGLWDNTPEINYLSEKFTDFPDKKLKRKVNINTVDINTGEIYRFNEDLEFDQIPTAVSASSSMPFAFPHTQLDGHSFVDGGSVWNIDLSGAIDRCHEIVDDDEDIIVDVVMCNGAFLRDGDNFKHNTAVQNYGRYQEIRSYYATMSDYWEIKRGFPKINFRYVLAPSQPLPGGFLPLNFDHDEMVKNIEIGEEEGKRAVEEGANVLEETLDYVGRQEFCANEDEY